MTVVSDENQGIVTEVYIPAELFDITSDSVQMYALDAKTIGISNSPPKFWRDLRMWENTAHVVKEEGEVMIIFPNDFVRFYRPRRVEIAASEERDNVLLVVSS